MKTPVFETDVFSRSHYTRNLRAKLRNAMADLKWHKGNCKRIGILRPSLITAFQDWKYIISTATPRNANAVFYSFNIFIYGIYERRTGN